MRRGVKFAIFSIGDPQSPQVMRDAVALIAAEEREAGRYRYQPYEDYVVAGFFPNGEGTMTAVEGSILKAFAGKQDVPPAVRRPTSATRPSTGASTAWRTSST